MKTEHEVQHKLDITCGMGKPTATYYEGFVAALRWVLGPMSPEKAAAFACPKCGGGILKIEPCSGYFSYSLDRFTGEVIYHNNDFNSETTDDPWYECERCDWKADGKWETWYAKERPTDGDEEDSDGPN